MSEKLTIGQACKYVGVSRDTLRRWEKKGKIKPLRSPSNRRYYTKDQLDELLNKKDQSPTPESAKAKVDKIDKESLKLVIYSLLAVFLTFIIGLGLLFLKG